MIKKIIAIVAIPTFVLISCFSDESKYVAIRVRGSDSEVNLVQSIAENYMDTDSLVSVGVTGGGSGAGIAALINGKTDIANSSREIKKEEIEFARKRGIEPYAVIFAQDVLAMVINEANPVEELSIEQLGKLYKGEYKTWDKVGGTTDQVVLYGRQSSSGTYSFFRKKIVKDEYDKSMMGMSGTSQIVEAIRTDKNGIGYVSAGYIKDVKVLKGLKVVKIKKDDNSVAYSPVDKQSILEGKYPITRPLYQYTNKKPQGKLKEFILYQFTEEGLKLIEENGFYPPVEIEETINKLKE